MPVIEKELQTILKQLKQPDPDIRFDAVQQLEELKIENEEGIDIDVMVKMVEEAAQPFYEPVGEWDDPSYLILDFVCDYQNEEIMDAIVKFYSGFNWLAKLRALQYLLESDQEKGFSAFMDILEAFMKKEETPIPVEFLLERPKRAGMVVEKFHTYLDRDIYKYSLYELLLELHKMEAFYQFKKDEIFPRLLSDYKKELEKYMPYDSTYSKPFVYTAWKDNYLECRARMSLYLSLLVFYYSDEVKNIYEEALAFQDPILKTRAVVASLQKDIPVNGDILLTCASDLESSSIFHWELMRIRKEHASPLDKKQPAVARSHLFYHCIEELEESILPKEIHLVDYIDTQNHYGQPVRYYLSQVVIDGGQDLTGWIGAFALEEGDDSLFMWEGTYIDEVPFELCDVSIHKQRFIERRTKEKDEMQNTIHFEYIQNKNRLTIKGDTLYLEFKGQMSSIPLHKMKKITLENRKGGFLGLSTKEYIVVYNKENQEAAAVPSSFIDYGDLTLAIHHQTSHLKEPPFIEYIEFE